MSLLNYLNALLQVSVVIILCIGFTFTYMMEKFPNFAHTGFASIGTAISFYLVNLQGYNPYYTWPISTIIVGILASILYVLLVKPVQSQGYREITLTFMFLVFAQVTATCLGIFSYWLLNSMSIQSNGFLIFSDFRWNGIPGVKIITPLTVGGLLLCLWFFLNKTKYGIAMRAMAEDEKLAAALGVNIDLLHIATWFLSGSLAGLAGSIISMWAMTSVDFSDSLLVNVMAGSVVGGLSSITGAIFGGFFIAFSKVVLTWGLVRLFGVGMYDWSQFLPMIFMFLVLSIEPDGIIAMKGKSLTIHSVKEAYIRLKRALFNVFSSE